MLDGVEYVLSVGTRLGKFSTQPIVVPSTHLATKPVLVRVPLAVHGLWRIKDMFRGRLPGLEEENFGHDNNLVAGKVELLDSLPENCLRQPMGVDICGIEGIDAKIICCLDVLQS